jgi:uracil-DNA glycosylase
MLAEAGIPPAEVVCGAAGLCRPVSRELEGAVPASVWTRECAAHVVQLVRLTEPRLLLPLGHRAVRSLKIAFPQEESLQELRFPAMLGSTVRIGSVLVHPLYHTTVRARVTRPEREQRRDWRKVGRVWEWLAGGERGPAPRSLTHGVRGR